MPTTIRVSEETKKKLEEEKTHPRSTYEEVIQELIQEREAMIKRKIEKAKEEENIDHEDVKEALGL